MSASYRQGKLAILGCFLAEALGRRADLQSDSSVSGLNRLRSLDLGLEIADNVIQEAREALDELLLVLVAGECDPSVLAWFIRIAWV